jgi:hypothetical protein
MRCPVRAAADKECDAPRPVGQGSYALQATTSLVILGLVIARAVNICDDWPLQFLPSDQLKLAGCDSSVVFP